MVALAMLLSVAFFAPFMAASGNILKRCACDISQAALPNLPASLVAPNTTLSYVAVAVGTQNYTCGSTGTYTNVGAVAELFDISCLYGTVLFDSIQDMAMGAWAATPSNVTVQEIIAKLQHFSAAEILGQHYYITNPVSGSGLSPKWDFKSQGSVTASKVNSTTAPTGKQDIDWVALKALSGTLAKQIYRTDTRLGQPPANCTAGSPDITVKYTAKYWLFGSFDSQ